MNNTSFLELQYLKLVRACAKKVCKKFQLSPRTIRLFDDDDPDRRNCHGMCYSDGTIHLNFRKRRSGRYDPVESAIDTVIHELAHLKFPDHTREFWKLHQKMKRWFFRYFY